MKREPIGPLGNVTPLREYTVNEMDQLRSECWEQALHCFGTSYIFEQRAQRLRKKLHFLTFLGIIVPAIVGVSVMSWGATSWITYILLGLGSILGLIQLSASIWSLSYRWDDEFAFAQEALSSNRNLFDKYKSLATNPPGVLEDARTRLEIIDVENQVRQSLDEQRGITEEEKRIGMRAGLRQLKKACAGCQQVPLSMESSSCPVCGDFKIRRF